MYVVLVHLRSHAQQGHVANEVETEQMYVPAESGYSS